MELKDNLTRLREAKKWSQSELAQRAGVSQQTIAAIESGRTRRPREIFAIAAALGASVSDLDRSLSAAPERQQQHLSSIRNDRDLPVYAAVEGGDGSMIITWEPVEWNARPAPLVNVRGGYGIYVVGDSMFPAFEPGDVALVNPHIPPSPQRNAVFFQDNPNDGTKGMIKRLRRITSTEWLVEQHNPAREFALPRSEWTQCQIVVGKYAR